jgi:hypothetical protein
MIRRTALRRLATGAAAVVALATSVATLAAPQTASASGADVCAGGDWSLVLPGRTVNPAPGVDLRTTIPAGQLGTSFLVKGRYIEFRVTSATFAVTNWTLTGAPNPGDLTGGKRVVVFASKTPSLRGATLTSGLSVRLRDGGIVIQRAGTGVSMKIQSEDCAQGGVFQMEPERADGTRTTFTHRLAPAVFYFDNPNFRRRLGTTVPFVQDDGTVIQMPVPVRVNFASDAAPKLVGRDSAQVAERVDQCSKAFGTHCGGVSQWRVASGGRMGQVMGEDAAEVSPGATDCVTDCQAQNQIRGRAVVLGFPSPVPAAVRLTPRFP